MQRQADATPPSASQAAQARAARERLVRIEEAVAVLRAIAAVKARRGNKKRSSEPRVWTTDTDARVMKMASGGFGPAYNVHFATDVAGCAIVGVQVTNSGSDHGLLPPMLVEIGAAPVASGPNTSRMAGSWSARSSRRSPPTASRSMGRRPRPDRRGYRGAVTRRFAGGRGLARPHADAGGKRERTRSRVEVHGKSGVESAWRCGSEVLSKSGVESAGGPE